MAKKTLARIEEGATVTSVAYGCAALLDAGLAEQLGPGSAGEEGLDCGGRLAVRIGQRLQVQRHNLEAAAEALARIQDELRRWRRRRRRANADLYDMAKALRGYCRGAFAKGEGDEFLGLHGALPREPKELHAVFAPVVRRLADDDWPIPEQKMAGIKIGRHGVVKSVLKAHDELGTALAAIKEGETREAVAKAAKKRAKDVHGAFLDKSTRFLEAALELAGLDELVATVRPGVGRRGRPKKELAAGSPAGRQGLPAAREAPRNAALPAAPSAADGKVIEPPAPSDEPADPV